MKEPTDEQIKELRKDVMSGRVMIVEAEYFKRISYLDDTVLPELLEACKALMTDISTAVQLWQNGKLPESFSYDSYTKAEQAIAKAEKP